MEQRAKALKLKLDVRQSNHEGVLVDWLQEALAKAAAVIVNAGAMPIPPSRSAMRSRRCPFR